MRFIEIKHKCFDCGCDLGFIDSIDKRNYQFYKGKYYCKECFEDKR